MKFFVSLVFVFAFFYSCGQKKPASIGDTDFQRELNDEYKDASKSPLKPRDLRDFNGLDFFKFDSSYVATARFKRALDESSFKMKTTTDRTEDYLKYGELSFELKGKSYLLNVYQGQELMKKEGYADYLFLPFLDDTNGNETYSGGRYIDLRIPKGDTIVIDFNTAYNPYCAYNEKYSCPIVPEANYLGLKVKAGVKVFKK